MPVGPGKFRVVQTPKGPVRLHIKSNGDVNEAKNLKTGKTHTAKEFQADQKRKGK